MLFGRAKRQGRTVLLLDIENGSVGSALVRLADGEQPKLFGETRITLKMLPTRDSTSLMRELTDPVFHAVQKVSEVASCLRNTEQDDLRDMGSPSRAAVFFAAPWSAPNLGASPEFSHALRERVSHNLSTYFAGVPHDVYTATGAALASTRELLQHEESFALCLVSGEITEVTLVVDHMPAAYATVPRGHHSVVRTLRTHAGMTPEESLSAMRLAGRSASYPEPLDVAARDYASDIAHAVEKLFAQNPAKVERVYIVAYGGMGEFFARALSMSEALGDMLPGGSVRALASHHVGSYLSAHAEHPDLVLMLEAMFADSHL